MAKTNARRDIGQPWGQGFYRETQRVGIVDTVTGELWHAAADEQPKKISEKLR